MDLVNINFGITFSANDFSVEKMTQNDISDIFYIEKKLLGTGDIGTIASTLESETLTYYVLKYKGSEIVGFMEISMVKPDCELYDIAIKKEFQGNKLSHILMDFLIELCKREHCETIFLEVNSINSKAIKLYRTYGFENYFVRKNYYGKFDAVLMRKIL